MNKLFTVFLLFISFALLAQVPQGVGYQGVATDNNGIELVNQSISIKASVLSGSANGNVEWEETHATTTDAFGLFALTIGQGTSTGSGAQSSFEDISWGSNTHFLKIEMDATGGNNYSFMGTNQMMSVPYALYAENAGLDSADIADMFSSMNISSNNSGGCDWRFPLGTNGITIAHNLNDAYIVPEEKILFIIQVNSGLNAFLQIDGDNILNVNNFNDSPTVLINPIIVDEGKTVSITETYENAASNFFGLLIDKQDNITPIHQQLGFESDASGDLSYYVPSGKKLILLNISSIGSQTEINDLQIQLGFGSFSANLAMPMILESNTKLEGTDNNSFNGYLVDEDYFADCSGGSSSSSLDSAAIANMIATAGGGGCNYKFPEGLDGERMIINLGDGNYTVPTGKKLYMTNVKAFNLGAAYYLQLNNNLFDIDSYNPVIAQSGDIISLDGYSPNDSYSQVTVFGYLADEDYFDNCGGGGSSSSSSIASNVISNSIELPIPLNNINPLTIGLTYGEPYTVPDGKMFILSYKYPNWTLSNNYNVIFNNASEFISPLLFKSGDIIANESSNSHGINGFLIDEVSEVEPITLQLIYGQPYTVPDGKIFILTYKYPNWTFRCNSIDVLNYSAEFKSPLIFKSGDILENESGDIHNIHGYLVDEDYF